MWGAAVALESHRSPTPEEPGGRWLVLLVTRTVGLALVLVHFVAHLFAGVGLRSRQNLAQEDFAGRPMGGWEGLGLQGFAWSGPDFGVYVRFNLSVASMHFAVASIASWNLPLKRSGLIKGELLGACWLLRLGEKGV